MKKMTKRSGFTIVELVIVIAVIAVLAGVLIPTFGGIIERANYSNDNQIVANINKVLVVEDIITGREPNDVVEIQKYIKENGLSLKTKSEDNYIWYNIEKNQVFLAKLDLSGTNPALVTSEETIPVEFNKELTAPEAFISGYLFLSEEADGDLAECIRTLRNPESKQDLVDSLKAISELENGSTLYANLNALMNRTAVMTEYGTFYVGDAGNESVVTRIIVSSVMSTVEESSVSNLKTRFPNIIVVDFHSGVKNVTAGAVGVISSDSNKIYFVYNNDEIYAIDHANGGDIAYLITKDERGQFIGSVTLVYVDKTGAQVGTGTLAAEFVKNNYTFTYNFPYLSDHDNTTTGKYYTFDNRYSLYAVGGHSFTVGTPTTYSLTEDEKLLIDNDGKLVLYATFEEAKKDFQIGTTTYSSRYMTYLLAKGEITSGTITVISTTATLGNDTYKTLTIPNDVELLVPTSSFEKLDKDLHDDASFVAIDKDEVDGKTKLTIYKNTTLNIASGAKIYIDAKLHHKSTSYQCFITENCGVLEIEQGAKIISSGDITAYGVIRGAGEIIANDGTVTEIMTIYDWYGGSNAAVSVGTKSDDDDIIGGIIGGIGGALAGMDLSGKNVCPFNEWKADNIRAKTKLNYNSEYKAIVAIYLDKTITVEDFVLASNGTHSPLFKFNDSDSYIEKSIVSDGDTKLSLYGEIVDTSKSLTIPEVVSAYSVTINFANIPMPISHLDIYVASGSSLTISNNLYNVMPGSDIVVDGTLNIQGNTKVVMWKSNDVKFVTEFYTEESGLITKKREKITLTLDEDGKITSLTSQPQKKKSGSWQNDGNSTTKTIANGKYIAVSHRFSETAPATLEINGTLNMAAGDRFRGEITSENENGTAKVVTTGGDVKSCSFNMGWFIQRTDVGNYWYQVYINNQYGDKTWNGTYTYKEDTQLGYYTWQK